MSRKLETIDFGKDDENKMKNALKAARDKIEAEVTSGLHLTGKAGLIASVMDTIIAGTPMDKINRLCEKTRNEYIASCKGDPKLLKQLPFITARFRKQLDKIVDLSLKYVMRIKAIHGGKLTEAALLKMRDGADRAYYLSKILSKIDDPKVLNAIEFVMNAKTRTKEKYAQLCKYLKKSFDKGGADYGRDDAPLAWFMVNYLPERGDHSKEKFIEFMVAKGLKGQKLKDFLRAGCRSGAIPPLLAEKFVTDDSGAAFTKKEKEENRAVYKVQQVFHKRARAIIRESYGSYNPMARMFTLKNILILVAQVSSGVSIAGTLAANIFKGGGLKNPGQLVEAMTKPGMMLEVAKFGVATYFKKPRPGLLTEAGKRKTQDENRTAENLRVLVENNRGLNSFLRKDKFRASTTLREFMVEHGMTIITGKTVKKLDKPSYRKITLVAYKNWLQKKAAAKDPDGKYSKTAKEIGINSDGTAQINGSKTTNEEFKRLVEVFHVWGIGGKASVTEEAFGSVLNRARGGGVTKTA
jgi:hypothetical protein